MSSTAAGEGGPASVVAEGDNEIATSLASDYDLPEAGPYSIVETTLSNLEILSTAAVTESVSSEEAEEATTTTVSIASSASTSGPSDVIAASNDSSVSSHPAPSTSTEVPAVSTAKVSNDDAHDIVDEIKTSEGFVLREAKNGVVIIDREGEESTDIDKDEDLSVYQIKWAKFHSSEALAIVTQNENGPCPLLAIVNVLLLRGKLKIASGTAMITYSQLMALLWDCILTQTPQHISAGDRLNYEKNMNDALAVIHKLQTGLDVNVKFTGVADFEYTIESIIFDLLNISLYHGWLVDPQSPETEAALGSFSYNQIVERIISNKASPRPELVTEALLAEEFLENSKSQLTYHGICEMHNCLKEGELAVFFRNNHFSTIYKHKEELFLLVTDQGFVSEPNVMWETLANVEGDSHFVDQDFSTYSPSSSNLVHPAPSVTTSSSNAAATSTTSVVTAADEQRQIDADLLVALSMQDELDKAAAVATAAVPATSSASSQSVAAKGSQGDTQELADHQLAMALQQEEERLEAARQSQGDAGAQSRGGALAGAIASSSSGGAGTAVGRRSRTSSPGADCDGQGQSRRLPGQEKEKDKDCIIL